MKCAASALAALVFLAVPAAAADGHRADHHSAAQSSGPAFGGAMVDGEIRKVDKDAGKITIRHGPLTNLDMPAMTMVFRVKDAAMLDQVKVGDTVKFKAEKVDGNFTVTEIAKKAG